MHEMWANLLASQLLDGPCHPHFVEILPHFSPAEAKLLVSLRELDTIGEHGGIFLMMSHIEHLTHWLSHADDTEPKPWTFSCTLLYEFGFANMVGHKYHPPPAKQKEERRYPILFRTRSGSEFLKAVTM